MAKKFEIRNGVGYPKGYAVLFDSSADNTGLHLKNIFKSGELVEDSVTEKNSATAEKISVVHQEGIIHLTI